MCSHYIYPFLALNPTVILKKLKKLNLSIIINLAFSVFYLGFYSISTNIAHLHIAKYGMKFCKVLVLLYYLILTLCHFYFFKTLEKYILFSTINLKIICRVHLSFIQKYSNIYATLRIRKASPF